MVRCCHRQISRLVIEHRNRLLRFGTDIVFDVCQAMGVEVEVVETPPQEYEARLVHDVLELMTVFSAKLYGARGRKKNPK